MMPARNTSAELTLKSMKLDWSDVDLADADIVAQAAWHFAFPDREFPWEFFDPRPDLDDPEENRRVMEGKEGAGSREQGAGSREL